MISHLRVNYCVNRTATINKIIVLKKKGESKKEDTNSQIPKKYKINNNKRDQRTWQLTRCKFSQPFLAGEDTNYFQHRMVAQSQSTDTYILYLGWGMNFLPLNFEILRTFIWFNSFSA